MSDDLLLDPDIRVWVFLPIVIITFFVGILRHYVSILLHSNKKIELFYLILFSYGFINERIIIKKNK